MTPREKLLAVILLFTAWGGMVLLGYAPAEQFVSSLRDALLALGVFQATISNPKE